MIALATTVMMEEEEGGGRGARSMQHAACSGAACDAHAVALCTHRPARPGEERVRPVVMHKLLRHHTRLLGDHRAPRALPLLPSSKTHRLSDKLGDNDVNHDERQ